MNTCTNNSYNKKALIKNYVYDTKRLRTFVFTPTHDIYRFSNPSLCRIWVVLRIRYFIVIWTSIHGIGPVESNTVNQSITELLLKYEITKGDRLATNDG